MRALGDWARSRCLTAIRHRRFCCLTFGPGVCPHDDACNRMDDLFSGLFAIARSAEAGTIVFSVSGIRFDSTGFGDGPHATICHRGRYSTTFRCHGEWRRWWIQLVRPGGLVRSEQLVSQLHQHHHRVTVQFFGKPHRAAAGRYTRFLLCAHRKDLSFSRCRLQGLHSRLRRQCRSA